MHGGYTGEKLLLSHKSIGNWQRITELTSYQVYFAVHYKSLLTQETLRSLVWACLLAEQVSLGPICLV